MNHHELLEAAGRALDTASSLPVGVRSRVAALLGRQAVEEGLLRLWERRSPALARCTTRAQLLCLPSYISSGSALETAHVWSSLSGACHHHPYELAPTVDEIRNWLLVAGECLVEIER